MVITPERRALSDRAIQLRCERKSTQEIADILGVSRSYASELYCDPDGTKVERRKNRYRLPCPDCGTLMSGSDGVKGTPKHCAACERKIALPARNAVRRGTGPTGAALMELLGAGLRPMDARDRLGITKGRTSNMIDRLLRYGLIERIGRGQYRIVA